MLPHPFKKIEELKHYQNEPKSNGIYSRNNLPKVKDGTYVTNFNEYKSIGTHWIALYVNAENVVHLRNSEIQGKQITITNIYRIQAYDSIIRGYFCSSFIDFMLKDKRFLDHKNLFSSNDYYKNDKITLKYLQ